MVQLVFWSQLIRQPNSVFLNALLWLYSSALSGAKRCSLDFYTRYLVNRPQKNGFGIDRITDERSRATHRYRRGRTPFPVVIVHFSLYLNDISGKEICARESQIRLCKKCKLSVLLIAQWFTVNLPRVQGSRHATYKRNSLKMSRFFDLGSFTCISTC